MSWGETFIEGIFEQSAERRGARVAAPFSACSGKVGTGFANSTRARSENLERGGVGSAFRACALHAAQPRGTEPYAAPRSRSNRAIAARSSPMPASVREEVSTTSG